MSKHQENSFRLYARLSFRKGVNVLFLFIIGLSAVIVLVPLVAVLWSVIHKGFSSINLSFFVELPKPVGESGGGILHALLGTFCLVAGAMAIAIPLAIPAGVFLSSDRLPRYAAFVRMSADVLSGVPSIVIGIFVYTILVVPLRHFSGLAGAVALAIVALPTLARTTEEVVRMVPSSYLEAAMALGAPRWRVVLQVLLPIASRGVVAGIISATSRVAGETAPLMFTAFGSHFVNLDPLKPTAAVPLVIFNFAISPYQEWHSMAWAAALVLITLVLGSNLLSRWILARRS